MLIIFVFFSFFKQRLGWLARKIVCIIEEVWRQKARQNVGVFDWGARWNAALEIFGVIV